MPPENKIPVFRPKVFPVKQEDLPKNAWMMRACFLYDDEYSDCIGIRGRFQQYFVHGHMLDCSSWKTDANNCYKWTRDKDRAAAEAVIASEEIRRKARLDPHYKNPVWEDRTEPPSNWNAPLPPFLAERQKDTYLEKKAKEMKEGKNLKADRMCVIM